MTRDQIYGQYTINLVFSESTMSGLNINALGYVLRFLYYIGIQIAKCPAPIKPGVYKSKVC